MNVLVTGGAGFLGRDLLGSLIAAGHDVVSFDRVDPGIPEADAVRGDLGAHADVTATVAVHRPETIFHCGALLAAGAEENFQHRSPRRAVSIGSGPGPGKYRR